MGRHAVEREIVRQVDENLVDGIDVDVLGRHILEIDLVDAGAVLDVGRHAGRRNDVAQFQRQVFLQGGGVKAGGGKRPFSVRPAHGLVGADGIGQTLAVDLPDFLHHLKQPRAARNAAGFQAGRHRQADGLFAAGHIRHHQVGGEGVQLAADALHAGVKAFEVDGGVDVLVFCHSGRPPVLHGFLDEPAAHPPRKQRIHPLKKQMLFFAADDHGVTVAPAVAAQRAGGAEIPHRVDGKGAAIRPGDGAGLHIPGGVKLRGDFYIHPLRGGPLGGAAFGGIQSVHGGLPKIINNQRLLKLAFMIAQTTARCKRAFGLSDLKVRRMT